MTTVDGIHDASGKVDMIILQQDHIKQTDTMVTATTDLHSLLFEHTHTGGGLAGIKHTGMGTLQTLYISVGHGGNATHALHDIQHQTLRLQQ